MTHQYVSVEKIWTEERQRQEFKQGPIQDLADSILRNGLIHAPVVNKEFRLIAGERRLRALKLCEGKSVLYGDDVFEYPEIPVHVIDRDDPQTIFELELEENLRRVNLTPMEEAKALAQLHAIRLQANPAQTRKDTAQEISKLQGKSADSKSNTDEVKVAQAILVDQFKDDPEVQQAAKVSLAKAARVAKKKIENEILRALHADEAEAAGGDLFELFPGDAIEILPTLPKEHFDVLLFDPPYGIDADKFGEQAFALGHQYSDSFENASHLTNIVIKEGTRILKPNSHVLMFCAFELFDWWRKAYEERGYWTWPRPFIWSKGNQSHLPVPDYGPRYSYECILFAGRGKRKINRTICDVLHHAPPRDKVHAAEKPVSLIEELLDFVATPGSRILDPTVGSGSIFSAARAREVFVTGIELDERAYATARERMKG